MKPVRSRNPILFFSKREKAAIEAAIVAAEKRTSGEVRVHLEKRLSADPIARGREIFEKIGMTNTALRNGVLVLLGVADCQVVILGDEGIDRAVPPNFWQDTLSLMTSYFREDRFADGLVAGLGEIGEELSTFFPLSERDENELPDAISYSL